MSDPHLDSVSRVPDDQQTLWSRETAADLLERLAAELRARWRKGERPNIEQLGGVFPRVAEDAERLLDLIYHELLVREEFGERPEAEQFIARYPQLADRIRRLFEIHRMVEREEGRSPSRVVASAATGPAEIGPAATKSNRPATAGSSHEGQASRAGGAPSELSASAANESWGGVSARFPLLPAAPPDFELLHELGRGGMAVVYKARQISLNRVIALKMLAPARSAHVDLLGRFRQEAQAVAQLHHPHVVQIFEVGHVDERPYLVLEYVAGGTLQRWLDGRPIAPAQAARLIETLARAAHYAHRRGIVHRDLKPANILLAPLDAGDTRDGIETPEGVEARDDSALAIASTSGVEIDDFCPKLSDFGLAKGIQSESDLTLTGQVLGTPSYMSPEQASGKGEAVSPKSDIYSLGAILYQLLTGRPPFVGSSMLEVLDQVRGQDPVPPRRLQSSVPADLETICLRCLEKSPERRYETAEQLADDLRRYLDHVPILARPARAWERALKWTRRRPLVASLAATCVVLLLAGAAGIGWQTRRVHQLAVQAQGERDHARRLHREAVLQMHNATQASAEAQASADLADRRAAESRQNFQRAFEAVDGIRKLGSQCFQRPDRTVVGRELLDFTLQYYEGFVQDQYETPEVRDAAQQAFLNAGDIASALGDRRQAALSYQRAVELGCQRIQETPHASAPHGVLAHSQRKLGNARRRLDQHAEAEQSYELAIESYRRAAELAPDNARFRVLLANSRLNLAVVLRTRRHNLKAAEQYSLAEAELTEALSGDANPRTLGELATCLDDFGRLLWQLGNATEAEQKLRRAFEQRQRLYVRAPTDPLYRQLLARSHVSLALVCRTRGEWEAGASHCQQALTLLKELADEFPTRLDMRQELPATLLHSALTAVEAGDTQQAEQTFRDAFMLVVAMAEKFPDDVATTRSVAFCQYTLGEYYWEQGRQEDARECFRQSLARYQAICERWPDNMTSTISLAWVQATCPAAELRRLEEAMALARQAIAEDAGNASYWSTLAAIQFHRGDDREASEAAERSLELCQGAERFDFLLLALASFRRGEQEIAASWLRRFESTSSPRTYVSDFTARRLEAELPSLRERLLSPATRDKEVETAAR